MGETRKKPPCIICGTTTSQMWWKCCPLHVDYQRAEFVCETCVTDVHGLCVMQQCNNIGVKAVALKFGCITDEGFKLHEDKTRKVFLCEDHAGDIIILEPQH